MRNPLRPPWNSEGAERARHDARVPAVDQQDAAQEVALLVRVRSGAPRADVLAAVRHALRLPLGAGSVPSGALHLERADDTSVVIASVGRHGSRFRSALELHDHAGGCVGMYEVRSWHRRRGRICGAEQVRGVREAVTAAVRAADPSAQIEEVRSPTGPPRNGAHEVPPGAHD